MSRRRQAGRSPSPALRGGVGSIAIDMLAARGYEVIAVTGKAQATEYLQSLGASRVLLRDAIEYGTKALEATQFGGAIDNVGGKTLAWLTRTVGCARQHCQYRPCGWG